MFASTLPRTSVRTQPTGPLLQLLPGPPSPQLSAGHIQQQMMVMLDNSRPPLEPESSWGEDDGGYVVPFGNPGTLSFRMLFIDKDDHVISPWHNIPLFGKNSLLNAVCTTPPDTWVKYEFAQEEYTPLKIVKRNRKPSHFSTNAFLRHGLLPQTYQDPSDKSTAGFRDLPGCGTPLEVIDVGRKSSRVGQVYTVKPLGALPVARQGRIWWTIIAIAGDDPLAHLIKNMDDLHLFMPGTVEKIKTWLVERECMNSDEDRPVLACKREPGSDKALMVVAQANAAWQLYVDSNIQPEPWLPNADALEANVLESIWRKYTNKESEASIPRSAPEGLSDSPPSQRQEKVDRWRSKGHSKLSMFLGKNGLRSSGLERGAQYGVVKRSVTIANDGSPQQPRGSALKSRTPSIRSPGAKWLNDSPKSPKGFGSSSSGGSSDFGSVSSRGSLRKHPTPTIHDVNSLRSAVEDSRLMVQARSMSMESDESRTSSRQESFGRYPNEGFFNPEVGMYQVRRLSPDSSLSSAEECLFPSPPQSGYHYSRNIQANISPLMSPRELPRLLSPVGILKKPPGGQLHYEDEDEDFSDMNVNKLFIKRSLSARSLTDMSGLREGYRRSVTLDRQRPQRPRVKFNEEVNVVMFEDDDDVIGSPTSRSPLPALHFSLALSLQDEHEALRSPRPFA